MIPLYNEKSIPAPLFSILWYYGDINSIPFFNETKLILTICQREKTFTNHKKCFYKLVFFKIFHDCYTLSIKDESRYMWLCIISIITSL